MTGKINVVKVAKSAAREMFAGVNTTTKIVKSKTAYSRKPKHKKHYE